MNKNLVEYRELSLTMNKTYFHLDSELKVPYTGKPVVRSLITKNETADRHYPVVYFRVLYVM